MRGQAGEDSLVGNAGFDFADGGPPNTLPGDACAAEVEERCERNP